MAVALSASAKVDQLNLNDSSAAEDEHLKTPTQSSVQPTEAKAKDPLPDAATEQSELSSQIDDLLNHLTVKFGRLSGEILGKIDDMSRRLDTLEIQIKAGQEKTGEGEQGKEN
ncbi:hypothetical protein K470DRAFT_255200 [Piedraia hortae CBS 480.64]|uniref:Heat shock factor binding protein 1 n=1 Tax=Piedraia hortae CBS 480.64 TaxID=1314780 RepID=A0A6A7C7W2_9PEZI|nr:hypothetical protein K470DRAFT_255200 [Piedraia hortae CBS 480.64]